MRGLRSAGSRRGHHDLLAQLPDERRPDPAAATRCAPSPSGSENENVLPLPGLAFDPDASAVMLDDLPANRQPEAGAFRLVGQRVAHLLEALEHLRLIGGRDAHAGVDDADDDISVSAHARGRSPSPASVNLTALEIRLITTWIRRSRSPVIAGRRAVHVLDQLEPLLLEQRRGGGGGVIDDVLASMTGSMCHSSLPASILARSSTSSISLVSRSPSLTTTFRFSSTCCIVCCTLRSSVWISGKMPFFEPLLDDLGEAEHRGERRAQLVADRREERALGGVGFFGRGAGALRFLEQPPVLVLLFVDLPVGVGVVERDRGERREVLHHVQVVLGVGVFLEALDGDDAETRSFDISGR